ncbi:MAG: glycosyltransferase family 39 protein [Candidatus Goldbacteria bacterium]|nr:glycosyltransferase family 39 protein [Candidatus Goldiibacteriota bacterium]
MFIIISVYIYMNVPPFSDGAIICGVIREISNTGNFPTEDFQGIQRLNLTIPYSIKVPFVYYPSFYILGSCISLITGLNENYVVFFLNLVPIIVSMFLIFLIFRMIFNENFALVITFFYIFSNIWLWLLIHRLIDTILIMFFLFIFYIFLKINKLNKLNIIGCSFLLVGFLLFKQTVYFMLPPLFFFLLLKFDKIKVIYISVICCIIFLPFLIYCIKNTNSLTLIPKGIPFIEEKILNPWWNNELEEWDKKLNDMVNYKELRAKTLNQFKEVQMSLQNLINKRDYGAIIQNFFLYPINNKGIQGYSSIVQKNIYKSFLILFIISFIFFIKFYKSNILQENFRYYIKLLIFSIFIVIIGWFYNSVFRYYIYIGTLTLFLIFYFLLIILRENKYIFLIVFFVSFLFTIFNIKEEIKRDFDYQYTIGHRFLSSKNGGLYEVMEASHYIKNNTFKNQNIFSNIPEISYYAERKIIWDDRLFFIEKEMDLIFFLKKFNFKYLAIPFYSGTVDKKDWRYFDGIPSDSLFNKLLQNSKYFSLVKKYNGFTIYIFNFE